LEESQIQRYGIVTYPITQKAQTKKENGPNRYESPIHPHLGYIG